MKEILQRIINKLVMSDYKWITKKPKDKHSSVFLPGTFSNRMSLHSVEDPAESTSDEA